MVIAMFQVDIYNPNLWRVVKEPSFSHLTSVKGVIISLHHLFDDGQLGLVCLQYNQSATPTSPRTARHLCHHVESAFGSTKVRNAQTLVRIEYAHHTHTVEVKPFCHHLRTNQYIRLALLETVYDIAISRSGTCGIQIHSGYTCGWEKRLHFLFYLFSSITKIFQVSIATLGALLGNRITCATIMAHQPFGLLMVG